MLRAVQATTDLAWRDAVELAASIRAREARARSSCSSTTWSGSRASTRRVNAIVTVDAAGARAQAASAPTRRSTRGDDVGPLHGLPVAVKDLADTAGLRTTYGSPIYRDHVPAADALVVERLRAAGAVIVGKTNTPEFGAGSQTFNPVFGVTRNPYDLARTAGGSSGGAAAAVACGLAPLADASDLGELDPQPRVVLQRRRPATHAGPDPRPLRGRRVGHDAGAGPDRAQRARHGPLPARRRRARPARPALAARRPARPTSSTRSTSTSPARTWRGAATSATCRWSPR